MATRTGTWAAEDPILPPSRSAVRVGRPNPRAFPATGWVERGSDHGCGPADRQLLPGRRGDHPEVRKRRCTAERRGGRGTDCMAAIRWSVVVGSALRRVPTGGRSAARHHSSLTRNGPGHARCAGRRRCGAHVHRPVVGGSMPTAASAVPDARAAPTLPFPPRQHLCGGLPMLPPPGADPTEFARSAEARWPERDEQDQGALLKGFDRASGDLYNAIERNLIATSSSFMST